LELLGIDNSFGSSELNCLIFELQDLIAKRAERGDIYLQFLSNQNLSVGLYELKAGSIDPQKPHTEDEVYYVVSGVGSIRVGNAKSEVKPGSIVFVGAGVDHKFFDIKEDLSIIVFFAPAHTPA
jgi:mannose-6-phosphate isomerase-like protein (cupin superfamily)